jgi:hypothetical protein
VTNNKLKMNITMRKLNVLFILGLALLSATVSTAHAQTWHMILPSPLPNSAPAGLGRDLLINPFTSSPAPGVFLAIEKSSSDGSEVPSVLRVTPTDASSSSFTIEPMDGGLVGASRLGYKQGDGLYSVGYSVTTTGRKGNAQSVMTWKVRRSNEANQGNLNTWQEDDSFQFAGTSKGTTTAYQSRAYGITTDASGDVYVCGFAYDGRVNHWIIRKKSSTGWATVRDAKAADDYSIPYDICFVPAGGNNPAAAIFAVGILNDRWTVLRSRDQGASWQPVGPWPADGSQASACDAAGDNDGNIYVVGVRGRDGYNRGWVLRKSRDGGTTWETLLDQPSTLDSWAVRLAIDGANNISLAGAIDGANGSPRWAVVRNSPGQLWPDSWAARIFPLGENTTGLSKGRGMAADASGNLFFTGDVINWTNSTDGTVYSGVGLLRMVP